MRSSLIDFGVRRGWERGMDSWFGCTRILYTLFERKYEHERKMYVNVLKKEQVVDVFLGKY
jgi:hypothetical protein